VLVLFITACANMPSTAFTNHDEKFTKIKLGDQRQQVESIWGKAEPETEIYPTAHFEILNYEDKQGRPFAFFTINPNTQEVFAKSKWIYSDDSQYNLKDLFENQFKDVQWTTYFPCSTRG